MYSRVKGEMLIQLRLDLKGPGVADEHLPPGIADSDRLSGSGSDRVRMLLYV
ncbi:MAG: hypothetical protein NTY03_09770 [Candidatus Bathyarchaeota archaeon]|nr:hypothetical protein [Candidatus Bathyarchaeota archaeon]